MNARESASVPGPAWGPEDAAGARGRPGGASLERRLPLVMAVLLALILSLSVGVTYVISYLLIPNLGGDTTMWWKLSTIITCGTLAGAIIPELVKVFTSTESRHVREVVTASREGGASLNILSGFIAGNFSAYWMGLAIAGLMGVAAWIAGSFPHDAQALMIQNPTGNRDSFFCSE